MQDEFVGIVDDIKDSWDILDGSNVADEFERRWCDWSVNDTIKWFQLTLINSKNINLNGDDSNNSNSNNNNGDEIQECSSESSDEDDDGDDETNNYNHDATDYQHVQKLLFAMDFNAKKDLPILVKPFQFKRFGFKNKNDCKLLCKKTQQLVKKYPKKERKQSQKCNAINGLSLNAC